MSDITTLRAEIRKLALHLRCDWCWQAVEIGRPYRRYRVFAQGEASTMREHPECYEAMCEAAEEEGGWIEWTPGQERPQEMSR